MAYKWRACSPVSGLLVDIVVLAVLAGFGYVGSSLGLVRASIRLLAAVGAFGVAALLRAPLARLIDYLTPLSRDYGSVIAMLGVGVGTYLAVAAIVSWYTDWVPHDRLYRVDRMLGSVPGVVLGVSWCGLMVTLVMLVPSNNVVTRASIQSRSGGVLLAHVSGLVRWTNRAFPRLTQTLPKGERGALVRADGRIPVSTAFKHVEDPDDAGVLLGNINQYRSDKERAPFTWNPELAEAATHHSENMLLGAFLSRKVPGGSDFVDRIKTSLGSNVARYDQFGVIVVWAHSTANAYAEIVRDSRTRATLRNRDYLELGIGVIDGGWFNGRMYTLAFVGSRDSNHEPSSSDAGTDSESADSSAGGFSPVDPAVDETATDDTTTDTESGADDGGSSGIPSLTDEPDDTSVA